MDGHEQRLLQRILDEIAESLGRPSRPAEVGSALYPNGIPDDIVNAPPGLSLGGMELSIDTPVGPGLEDGPAWARLRPHPDPTLHGVVQGTGWSAPVHIDPGPLTDQQRMRFGHHFLGLATSECAQYQAFTQLSLGLVHLGAPAQLALDCHAAAIEKLKHARLAFGLARRVGSGDWRPAPIPGSPVTAPELQLRAVLTRIMHESCIQETLHAVCLNAAADRAIDPVLSTILDRLGREEEGHAALGWRTARWLLHQDPKLIPYALDLVHKAFEEGPDEPAPHQTDEAVGPHDAAVLEDWGRLRADTRRTIREAAFMSVVLPATSALR